MFKAFDFCLPTIAAKYAAMGLMGSNKITGTENKASDGYGGSDLIQFRNLRVTRCLSTHSEMGLASPAKIRSTRK